MNKRWKLCKLGQYNPDDLTAQEVFDISCGHVLAQGKPSIDSGGNCLYDNGNGLHCAAAMFLDKRKLVEGTEYADVRKTTRHMRLIVDLQYCHDRAYDYYDRVSESSFVDSFIHLARRFAEKYNLDPSILEGA